MKTALLALVLGCLLVGCGGDDSEKTTTTAPEAVATAVPEPTTTPEPPAATAAPESEVATETRPESQSEAQTQAEAEADAQSDAIDKVAADDADAGDAPIPEVGTVLAGVEAVQAGETLKSACEDPGSYSRKEMLAAQRMLRELRARGSSDAKNAIDEIAQVAPDCDLPLIGVG